MGDHGAEMQQIVVEFKLEKAKEEAVGVKPGLELRAAIRKNIIAYA